jgi:acetyltransferase
MIQSAAAISRSPQGALMPLARVTGSPGRGLLTMDLPGAMATPKAASVRVRPVSQADGERIQAFVRGLSVESRRARFFSPIRELSSEQLERMTQLAFPETVGLVAETADATRQLVGIAQYASDDEGPEFAVVVADAWQARGVGRRLVRQIVALAGVAGFAVLRGFVLGSNAAMLTLARSIGFTVVPDRDPTLVRVSKVLPRAIAAG